MSEADLEAGIRSELAQLGVVDYWYDVPIMVLAGSGRFLDMTNDDYESKSPSTDVQVHTGDPVFVDIHPRSENGRWGNYARTFVVNPTQNDQLLMLGRMRDIQMSGIKMMPHMKTTLDLANYYGRELRQMQIELVDVRGNFGHNMGSGEKKAFTGRTFIDDETMVPLVDQIWGVEPGGFKTFGSRIVVARFEDCVHVANHSALMLGGTEQFNPNLIVNAKRHSKPR